MYLRAAAASDLKIRTHRNGPEEMGAVSAQAKAALGGSGQRSGRDLIPERQPGRKLESVRLSQSNRVGALFLQLQKVIQHPLQLHFAAAATACAADAPVFHDKDADRRPLLWPGAEQAVVDGDGTDLILDHHDALPKIFGSQDAVDKRCLAAPEEACDDGNWPKKRKQVKVHLSYIAAKLVSGFLGFWFCFPWPTAWSCLECAVVALNLSTKQDCWRLKS